MSPAVVTPLLLPDPGDATAGCFAAVSSDDALVDYTETTQVAVFTPFISFLVVLVSFLTLIAIAAFFTDIGYSPRSLLSLTYSTFQKRKHDLLSSVL